MLVCDVPLQKFLPTLPRSEPLIKDHTCTKVFKECPRKYFYRIVLGYTLEDSKMAGIFAWGSAAHKFAEEIYQDKPFNVAFVEALKIFKQPAYDSKWNHLDAARFTSTCKELHALYTREKENGNVIIKGIEQPFNVLLPDGTRIGGRFDMLIERNGRPLVRDWKTTTKQTSWFALTLNPNDQATRYAYAASVLAGWNSSDPHRNKVDGVEFIVIENQKPTKSSPNNPKLSSQFISKSHEDLISWERDQMMVYKQIDLCRVLDVWPMHENHCDWCDYAVVCRQPTDASRAWKLKNDYQHRPWDHQKVDQANKAE